MLRSSQKTAWKIAGERFQDYLIPEEPVNHPLTNLGLEAIEAILKAERALGKRDWREPINLEDLWPYPPAAVREEIESAFLTVCIATPIDGANSSPPYPEKSAS
jgi:hypothetical protein